jgi:hypothetical protein
MPGGEKRNRIVSDILYYYDNEQEIIQEQGWDEEICRVPLGFDGY